MNAAAASGDTEALIRYVRLHVGDGDEAAGRREIDKAWVQYDTLRTRDRATLAHLFFSLHFHLVRESGEWIHDGDL